MENQFCWLVELWKEKSIKFSGQKNYLINLIFYDIQTGFRLAQNITHALQYQFYWQKLQKKNC